MKMQINEADNIFDILPDNITTVESIIEYIEITQTDKYGDSEPDSWMDFSKETIQAVKDLNLDWSIVHDDFFNTDTNKIMSKAEICKKYNLTII